METKTLTSDHVNLKKKILDAAIRKHRTVITDFQTSIKDLMASVVSVNEDEVDLTQRAHNAEVTEKSNQIADQLAFANQEMALLLNMTSTIGFIHNQVQAGSVVVTDRQIFFVSASIEEFKVDDLQLFGLSAESPLFKAMEGKKKGDRFTHNYSEYKIVETF